MRERPEVWFAQYDSTFVLSRKVGKRKVLPEPELLAGKRVQFRRLLVGKLLNALDQARSRTTNILSWQVTCSTGRNVRFWRWV